MTCIQPTTYIQPMTCIQHGLVGLDGGVARAPEPSPIVCDAEFGAPLGVR